MSQELTLRDTQPASSELEEKLLKKISDGMTVGSENAHFITVTEKDGRSKKFLQKEQNSIESKYGSDLARILSNKQFAIKRELLELRENGDIKSAIKFDEAISVEYFLDDEDRIPSQDVSISFAQNYARLSGVMHVLGDYDWSEENFLKSRKTGRPVKIDNSFLSNNVFFGRYARNDTNVPPNDYQRFRIYGSYQSQALLQKRFTDKRKPFSGRAHDEAIQYASFMKTRESETISLDEKAQAFITFYNYAINESLLEEIKENFKNPKKQHLKKEFIEFMSGIEDAIALAQDDDF